MGDGDREYTTKSEFSSFKKEVYEGFDRVNKSIENLSHEITSTIQKSMSSDFSLRSDVTKEFEERERIKRQTTLKISGLAITLILSVFSSIWWAMNQQREKELLECKSEIEIEALEYKMSVIKEFHVIDNRLLKLEE